jgi:hypothetical protein
MVLAKSWEIASNGFYVSTVDMGRVIGTKRACGSPTSLLRIVLDKNVLRTMYPF